MGSAAIHKVMRFHCKNREIGEAGVSYYLAIFFRRHDFLNVGREGLPILDINHKNPKSIEYGSIDFLHSIIAIAALVDRFDMGFAGNTSGNV